MIRPLTILLLFYAVSSCTPRQTEFPALEVLSIHQLDQLHGIKFDLSGIALHNDTIYVVADKPWNRYLYAVEFANDQFHVYHQSPIDTEITLDIEGVDYCGTFAYVVNERGGEILAINQDEKVKVIDVSFDSETSPGTWGNAGWEGVALNCEENILYVVKEREPRGVFEIDLKTGQVNDTFNIPETESNDFSDVKYENGFLYLLERSGNFVTKVDAITKEVVAKYHYKSVASHPDGKLYAPTPFGMAEALLLTEDEIWLGLDNNGLKVSEYAYQTYGIVGNAPIIIKFRRPAGF